MYKTSACVQPVREKKTSGLSIKNPTGTSWKIEKIIFFYSIFLFIMPQSSYSSCQL